MSKKILIVDDAMFMRMVIKDVATDAGWEICAEAANGQEAVDLYKEHRPDLVTMDMVMPEKDGMTALEEILEFDKNAKVVVVSALDQKETLVETIQKGAIDFIVKPFERDRILGILNKVS